MKVLGPFGEDVCAVTVYYYGMGENGNIHIQFSHEDSGTYSDSVVVCDELELPSYELAKMRNNFFEFDEDYPKYRRTKSRPISQMCINHESYGFGDTPAEAEIDYDEIVYYYIKHKWVEIDDWTAHVIISKGGEIILGKAKKSSYMFWKLLHYVEVSKIRAVAWYQNPEFSVSAVMFNLNDVHLTALCGPQSSSLKSDLDVEFLHIY